MKIEKIKSLLQNRKKENIFEEFSVLIPLIKVNNKTHLLFEQRSYHLNSQPGDICFPGGKKENNETPSYSALRETIEELNLKEDNIEIFNCLGEIYTPFNYKIHIYIGHIKNIKYKDINFNKQEVQNIFTVPLENLLNTSFEKYNLKTKFIIPRDFPYKKIENGEDYNFKTGNYEVYFYEHNKKIIWGITGKILNIFLKNIKGLSNN
ncbi:MAG: NUDIX hydrolase [Bacillota bacterium]